MKIIFTVTLIMVSLSMILFFALQGGFSKSKRRAKGFWRRLLLRQVLLLPVYVCVLLPALIGFAGSRMVGTRPDERGYVGVSATV